MDGSQVNKIDLLHRLILEWENETIEFKSTNPGRHDISEYVSALANEAFLNNKQCGWYVMGVDNKSHEIVGTQFKNQPGQISDVLTDIKIKTGAMSDVRVDEITINDKRVLIFRIAAARPGCPIYSQGYAHGRNGDQLVALSKEKEDQIRFSAGHYDWSAQLAHNSSTEDLDIHALSKAREVYLSRKPHLTHEGMENPGEDNATILQSLKCWRMPDCAPHTIIGKTRSREKKALPRFFCIGMPISPITSITHL